ncbi:CASP-like protein [Gossypium australe]|uniref:CASP-like protein n=1 Tax=Gossypium australe TaxID=47621 RepID=A0A5B6WD64_9ROSI|nr:CASP-like protein [Gossypium australe]
MMEPVPGALGTSASLALHLGQTIFSSASLLFMCLDVEFYNYTSFSYLVTVMALVTPWSVSLALIDAYSVFIKCLPRQPRVLLIVIVGDWVYSKALSFLSLAAACSTASVTSLLVNVGTPYCWSKLCSRYHFSAAMAFLSWFLSFASTLFNLWLLPSL